MRSLWFLKDMTCICVIMTNAKIAFSFEGKSSYVNDISALWPQLAAAVQYAFMWVITLQKTSTTGERNWCNVTERMTCCLAHNVLLRRITHRHHVHCGDGLRMNIVSNARAPNAFKERLICQTTSSNLRFFFCKRPEVLYACEFGKKMQSNCCTSSWSLLLLQMGALLTGEKSL